MSRRSIERLTIERFKSIREQTLLLRPLNVFIGGNGVGKSNLIEVFRFLREIVSQNLAGYTAQKGGADSLLYFGRTRSKDARFHLEFSEGNTSNAYEVTLAPTDEDGFYINQETVFYHEKTRFQRAFNLIVSSGSPESRLRGEPHICAREARVDLESYRVYHFHDTSDSAAVKRSCDVDDNRVLRPQAENLAAFLYWLQEQKPDHFTLIESTLRQVAPFFSRFQLSPSRLNEEKIRLEWQEHGSDSYFNATSLSDGTLRFLCLATLLLQPDLPAVVLLDEPELGLHPAAIKLLADLLLSAAARTQVIVATQSVTLVNQLDPQHVWTVEREGGQSVFANLAERDMTAWLEGYALGDLWEKNVLGARP